MTRAPLPSAAALASTLALLFFAQCRRQEIPRADTTPPAADGARAVAEPPPAASPVAASDAAADAGPPPSVGNWLEGNIYRFRLEEVRQCPPPAAAGSTRIGVVVRVTSKMDELLVAPRDVKLESGGVILDSAILPKAPAPCAPLLAPKSLRAGKTADGVVVFDLPAGFNPDNRPVKVTYQPTRWGGARRVEAVLPSASLAR